MNNSLPVTSQLPQSLLRYSIAATCCTLLLVSCATNDGRRKPPPQLAEAVPGTLLHCASLSGFGFSGTTISSATLVTEGAVSSKVGGVTLAQPAHCLVAGEMNPRTGVDGKHYAIRFEMRLPVRWNGRFFHQANGGSGGVIDTDNTRAYGQKLGDGANSNGLMEGFAVLTSDSGHVADDSYPDDPQTGFGISGLAFGLDPQARLDYGYTAVGTLTPMAKSLIGGVYGRGPDRSYMVGCSNGGRLGVVTAARYAQDYDGILAGNPGINLPRAAIAEQWDSQALMASAQSVDPVTQRPAIWTALSSADMGYVNKRILEKCDLLDGAKDGMVGDVLACQAAFSPARDVEVCAPGKASDGTCLTSSQLTTLRKIFGGPKDSRGQALYADWPFANGIDTPGWRFWKMGVSNGKGTGAAKYGLNLARAGVSGAFVFSTPPADPAVTTGHGATLIDWVLNFNFDQAEALVNGTNARFTQSAMAFMAPPNPTDLSALRNRGGKVIVFHGSADPVFSYNDTLAWYAGITKAGNGDATDYARVFTVPGMNHCSGGPATDQFDLLTPLVNWVEKGQAPDRVIASAGTAAQNPGLGSVPSGRTRPLCAYPKVARYLGSGSLEDAANFTCK